MIYEISDIRSVENLPQYRDVDQEVLPPGSDPVRLRVQWASVDGLRLHLEAFRSRLRYSEFQSGGTIYIGLFLPSVGPLLFDYDTLREPTLICWHGLDGPKYDFVVEPGARNYMLDVQETTSLPWSGRRRHHPSHPYGGSA